LSSIPQKYFIFFQSVEDSILKISGFHNTSIPNKNKETISIKPYQVSKALKRANKNIKPNIIIKETYIVLFLCPSLSVFLVSSCPYFPLTNVSLASDSLLLILSTDSRLKIKH